MARVPSVQVGKTALAAADIGDQLVQMAPEKKNNNNCLNYFKFSYFPTFF
jgi:hypothetical protein